MLFLSRSYVLKQKPHWRHVYVLIYLQDPLHCRVSQVELATLHMSPSARNGPLCTSGASTDHNSCACKHLWMQCTIAVRQSWLTKTTALQRDLETCSGRGSQSAATLISLGAVILGDE